MFQRLGVSLYPDFSSEKENIEYIKKAKSYGFDVLFIALLAVNEEKEKVIRKYKKLMIEAKNMGYEIMADVNPRVFNKLGINASVLNGAINLDFFKELQIDIIRLDMGMSDLEETFLTKNKENIKICFNASSCVDHVSHILQSGGDPKQMIRCHNYFPHRYTGLTLPFYMKGSKCFVDNNIRTQAFVSSQIKDTFGPWPICEGLPTLEIHRDLPIDVQAKHLLMLGNVNDLIIGNCFASDEELKKLSQLKQQKNISLNIRLVENLSSSLIDSLKRNYTVRYEENEYMIRTLESRLFKQKVEPFNCVDIQRGDILIDNCLYGQYSGEIQIALNSMKNSGKTNVIAHIEEDELFLIDYLKAGQSFCFGLEKENQLE